MEKPLRVLVVEDSENDAVLLIRELQRGGYVPAWERVDNLESLGAALSKGSWDIVISDHSMPGFSAIKAIEYLKYLGLDVPVIILSGAIDEEAAVAAMRAGASDYIMKGNTARLLPAIEREIREAQARRNAKQVGEQFRQAQKMEAVGRLAGGVAHDFNNLLTAILGNCAFLLNDIDQKKIPRREEVEGIKDAADRAATLSRQLLAFSRKQILAPKVVDLNAVVINVEKLLRRLIGEDIELVTALGTNLGRVRADPSQIEQAMMNLAVNARDAMPNGGKLTIQTADVNLDEGQSHGRFEIKPGSYVMIAVGDTGCGMDGMTMAHLFEPFFTTKEMGKGTGLGLSTVHGIVEQNSGYVWADSAPGKGTTFKLYFPAVNETADPPGKVSAPAGSLNGSETILVAEDDERVGNLIKRILSRHGYTVLLAASGEEALRICREHKGGIQLLATDVVMPKMSGGSLAKEAVNYRPEIKVLYLSEYPDSIIADQGGLKPGIHFLQKPFTSEDLARKVREVLEAGAQGPL